MADEDAAKAKGGKAPGREKKPPARRVRRSVPQNAGRCYCWATSAETGEPCTALAATSGEGANLPYCDFHLRNGDGALQVVDHPTMKGVGKIVVARVDIPRGYKFVYWGKRVRWRGCQGPDKAMSFVPNGGVIDPTGCEGQQVQCMACPGPSERSNTKVTTVCFGKTYDRALIGRELETTELVKKGHQLLQWYGSKEWFEARGIPRTNVGTEEYPTPQRKKKPKPMAPTRGKGTGKGKGQEEGPGVEVSGGTGSGLVWGPRPSDLGGRLFEYSIHKLQGEPCSEQVGRVFPDLRDSLSAVGGTALGNNVLAVPTFQHSLLDLHPESGAPGDAVQMEMNKLHLNFVALESEVYGELTRLGYFCDSIDPLTGCAMHSRSGERYSEAVGSRELLGYEVRGHLIVHPQFGSCCYPVTLFSNAPVDVVSNLMENALFKLQTSKIINYC